MSDSKQPIDDLRIDRSARTGRPAFGWVLPLLLVLALALAALWWVTRPHPLALHTVLARDTQSAPADRTVLNASGYVTARREATVSSKVTGKVTEVLIEEGMHVQEGQVLARLDDTNVRASLLLAEAQLVSASNALAETRVRIREADQELQRQAGLLSNNIATHADYDHAQAAYLAYQAHLLQQQADVLVAQRTIQTWQQQLDDTIIRSPFAGIVTSKNAQPGEMISPISAGGGFTRTGIGTVVDMTSLEIEIDVNESYINRVEPGQPVEAVLDAYPDWKIPCKVIAIIPTADRQKSTVKVRVGFDKLDPRILPDMSVKVAFHEMGGTAPAGHAVIVPRAAVHQQDGRDLVLVVQDQHAQRRSVVISNFGADEAIITAGLSPGERVAVDWPDTVTTGAAVTESKAQ
ncbi:MAG TPA: efflux RND transporter periplasmic adaptor subunit [Verrucomicrobiae bacterium]|nr:efflux RND transporter periplasmic adaptor subunit [Verrucomicrobiae bacterium]